MVSPKGKKTHTGRNWVETMLFPPIALLPILMLGLLLGDSSATGQTPVPLLSAMVFLYIALAISYRTLCRRGHPKAAYAVSISASGLLLIFVSAEMGSGAVFGWAGLMLLLAGVILILTQLSPPPAARFAKANPDLLPESVKKEDIGKLLSAIPFPGAFLEMDETGEERVVAANEPLAAVLGKNAEKMAGGAFQAMLPPMAEGTTFRFADAEWVPHRTARGKQALFMLSPSVKLREPDMAAGLSDVIGAETGLYTGLYMKYRANADVQACRRYKRRLAVVIFRLQFDGVSVVVPSEETKRTAFQAFAQMVSVSVRACDTAYGIKEYEVVLFLPDAPQDGAKSVVTRMQENVRKLAAIECAELASARLLDATVNFFGEEIVSVDQVMKEVYLAMERNARE